MEPSFSLSGHSPSAASVTNLSLRALLPTKIQLNADILPLKKVNVPKVDLLGNACWQTKKAACVDHPPFCNPITSVVTQPPPSLLLLRKMRIIKLHSHVLEVLDDFWCIRHVERHFFGCETTFAQLAKQLSDLKSSFVILDRSMWYIQRNHEAQRTIPKFGLLTREIKVSGAAMRVVIVHVTIDLQGRPSLQTVIATIAIRPKVHCYTNMGPCLPWLRTVMLEECNATSNACGLPENVVKAPDPLLCRFPVHLLWPPCRRLRLF